MAQDTLQHFAGELKERQRKRQRTKREDKKRERQERIREQLSMGFCKSKRLFVDRIKYVTCHQGMLEVLGSNPLRGNILYSPSPWEETINQGPNTPISMMHALICERSWHYEGSSVLVDVRECQLQNR